MDTEDAPQNENDGGADPEPEPDPGGAEPKPAEHSLSGEICALSPEDRAIVAETFVSPNDALALSVRNEGAMLSWVGFANGKRKVTPMWFSQSTTTVAGSALTNIDSVQLEPATAATREGFMAVWSDDQAGSFELFARVIDASGQHTNDAVVRLTQDDDDDRAPVVSQGADENLLIAWRSELASDQGRTLLLAANGKVQGSAHDIPGFGATLGRPALSALGGGYVLAWVDAASQQVRLQRLNAEGAPMGDFVRADMDGGAAGHLELSTSELGGALAFDMRVGGERAEVRFRAFDANGELLGPERSLTRFPETGLAPTIKAFRGGYAVAYRSATDGQTVLRMAFVDSLGGAISAFDIATLRDLNLPTVLGVSPDGTRMFVAWTDRVEDSGAYELRRAWLRCD